MGRGSGFAPPFLAWVCGLCRWAWVMAGTPPILPVVLGRVCLCACSAWTPPLLARMCGVGVCAWVRFSAAPRHSWLGFWVVCFGVCAPSGPRKSTLGCGVGVCASALVSPAPCHSGLGCCVVCFSVCAFPCTPPILACCAVYFCVLAPGLRLRPAIPGWGFWACVFVCALRLYPANPGSGVRCRRVCFGSGFGCAPPFLAGVLGWVFWCLRSVCPPPILAGVCCVGVCASTQASAGCVQQFVAGACVFVCALRLYPANLCWGVRCGCVCLASGFGCLRLSWLGCWGVCVCLCARWACSLPVLAGVCCLGVSAWAPVSAASRLSWQRCWVVCFGVCAPPVRRQSWLGYAVCVCVFGLRLWLRPAIPGLGVGLCVCLRALRINPG